MEGKAIVDRIKVLLRQNGKSMQEFYKDCELSSAALSLWNTGKTVPRQKNLERIAEYLGTTAEYLAYGIRAPEITFAFKTEPGMTDAELDTMRKEMENYWKFLMSKR